jgi:hypothetical protein
MELLLNLFWLALALPAAWLLKKTIQSAPAQGSPAIGLLRSAVLLACVLTLLFPVVSASDDLHAMRPEIEESGTKRVSRQVAANRSVVSRSGVGPFSALPVLSLPFSLDTEISGLVSVPEFFLPDLAPVGPRSSRGPPSLSLA